MLVLLCRFIALQLLKVSVIAVFTFKLLKWPICNLTYCTMLNPPPQQVQMGSTCWQNFTVFHYDQNCKKSHLLYQYHWKMSVSWLKQKFFVTFAPSHFFSDTMEPFHSCQKSVTNLLWTSQICHKGPVFFGDESVHSDPICRTLCICMQSNCLCWWW